MKKHLYFVFFTIAFSILLSSCCNAPTETKFTPTDADIAALKQLKEVNWPKAYATQDTLLLDEILGDDFKSIDNGGNWSTKQDAMDWIRENKSGYDAFHFETKRFEFLENGTALICGTGHITIGTDKVIYQSSNIFIKRNGKWKAVLSHVSGAQDVE